MKQQMGKWPVRPAHVTGARLLLLVLALALGALAQAVALTRTPHGAIIETARYRAVITNGVVTGFRNKLTGEEYINPQAQLDQVLPHLPSGLGTLATDEERGAAVQLFSRPWWEFSLEATWPNQHYPDATSTYSYTAGGADSATLTYTGLTDGQTRYDDEVYALDVAIDAPTGDLLLTPSVTSPRGGVYGCGLTVAPLANPITIEAPIFEGVRLDRQMKQEMWVNQWANFWDYAFLALNGEKTGAVGVWCQDADLKLYKTLFYMMDQQGISFSVQAMNIPPFDDLKTSKPIAWRLQAFDKSWSQAAARFRAWRQANVKIPPRPDWVKNLSFMYYGMDKAGPSNINPLEQYFEGKDLDRVVTWAAAVRGAGFDQNHTNNDPYPGFREDMQKWKEKNLKVMVYLQPMIMNSPNPQTDRQQKGLEYSRLAGAQSAFRGNRGGGRGGGGGTHNLAQPEWQRWFLDWVKEYIQDYGADGIYNDETYVCPIDGRGLVNGMTSTQGMADFFTKEATENPNAIQGTEHMTEVNSVGASLGLGCGIIWGMPGYQDHIGPPGSMNWQRIMHPSAVSNALHYPNGAIFGFPHKSEYADYGAERFHYGMDQMEGRGDLPTIELGEYGSLMQAAPFAQWANEVWLDHQRAVLFVHNGLRATFPEDWQRNVLSYFRGAKGEDFRYVQMPWGSEFVQYQGRKAEVQYARITGVTHAAVGGAIVSWPCYDKDGPAGLNPSITYVVDPACPRPASWFSLGADDVCIADGFANGRLAFMQLQPIGNAADGTITVTLHSAVAPKAIWVDGQAVTAKPAAKGSWEIQAGKGAMVAALLQEPAAGFAALDPSVLASRYVDAATKRDIVRPAFLSPDAVLRNKVVATIAPNIPVGNSLSITLTLGEKSSRIGLQGESQSILPLKAPATAGMLHISMTGRRAPACCIDGKTVALTNTGDGYSCDLPMKANELALLQCTSAGSLTFDWQPTTAAPAP